MGSLVTAQQTTFSINLDNMPLDQAIRQIEEEFQCSVSYRLDDIEEQRVTCEILETSFEGFMTKFCQAVNLRFTIESEKFVVLSKAELKRICGYIKDSRGSLPMGFANVALSGTSQGVNSREDGYFELEAFASDTLIITYVGYKSKVILADQIKSTNCETFFISPSAFIIPDLVIQDYITDGVNLEENGSNTSVKVENLGVLPGKIGTDILDVAQFFPGVNTMSSRASDLTIRGGTPDQNLFLWENIPLYHVGHVFGMVSALNPSMIESMSVYRGGFNAQYGGRVAGIIDMKSKGIGVENHLGGEITMTSIGIDGLQYLNSKKKTVIGFSVRRSYAELFRTPTMNNISQFNQQGFLLGSEELINLPDHITITDDYNFIDGSLTLHSQLNAKHSIALSSIYADNTFNDVIRDDFRGEFQTDSFDLRNIGINLQWKMLGKNNQETTLSATLSDFYYNYEYDLVKSESQKTVVKGEKNNDIQEQTVTAKHTVPIGKYAHITAGYDFTKYQLGYKVVEQSPNRKKDEGRRSEEILHAGYIHFQQPLLSKIGITAGLRTYYIPKTSRVYFEPRVRIAKQFFDKLTLNAYYGLHNQFISQVVDYRGNRSGLSLPIWFLFGEDIPVIQAEHLQAGIVYQINDWVIDIQAYQRDIKGISNRSYDLEVDFSNDAIGKSVTRGMDLLLKKQWKKYRTWIAYSIMKTDLSFSKNFLSQFNPDHDQRHTLNWSHQYSWQNLQVALGMRYGSGLPYSRIIDFDVESQGNDDFEYRAFYDGINTERLSSTIEVNASCQYKFQPPKQTWKGYVQLSITNMLNRNNVYNRGYFVDQPLQGPPVITFREKSNLRFTPNVSLRIEL